MPFPGRFLLSAVVLSMVFGGGAASYAQDAAPEGVTKTAPVVEKPDLPEAQA